jgi:hypothetical protein
MRLNTFKKFVFFVCGRIAYGLGRLHEKIFKPWRQPDKHKENE